MRHARICIADFFTGTRWSTARGPISVHAYEPERDLVFFRLMEPKDDALLHGRERAVSVDDFFRLLTRADAQSEWPVGEGAAL